MPLRIYDNVLTKTWSSISSQPLTWWRTTRGTGEPLSWWWRKWRECIYSSTLGCKLIKKKKTGLCLSLFRKGQSRLFFLRRLLQCVLVWWHQSQRNKLLRVTSYRWPGWTVWKQWQRGGQGTKSKPSWITLLAHSTNSCADGQFVQPSYHLTQA